jgi:hypothetical protein
MTLSAHFSLLHSDLNDFLFAPVGDEPNGMPLSVISALTRLGVDPWDEAARLAALPKVLAAEALAPMIARLPVVRSPRSDDVAVARDWQGFCQYTTMRPRLVRSRPMRALRNPLTP